MSIRNYTHMHTSHTAIAHLSACGVELSLRGTEQRNNRVEQTKESSEDAGLRGLRGGPFFQNTKKENSKSACRKASCCGIRSEVSLPIDFCSAEHHPSKSISFLPLPSLIPFLFVSAKRYKCMSLSITMCSDVCNCSLIFSTRCMSPSLMGHGLFCLSLSLTTFSLLYICPSCGYCLLFLVWFKL